MAEFLGIPVVESEHVPPRTAYLMRQDGRDVLLRRPPGPSWWRHPRRWLRQRRLDRWYRLERRRRAEMVEWLALYRPDLRFVGWGRHGGALVGPRKLMPTPPGVFVTSVHQDVDGIRLLAEMRVGMQVLDPSHTLTITGLA